MATINDVVARIFRTTGDPLNIVWNLDLGIHGAGCIVEHLRDLIIHDGDEPDREGWTAQLEALLTYLGQLGVLVDDLERSLLRPSPETVGER
jgi:hypothetical protein